MHVARHPMREHFVGNSGRMMAALRTVAPPLGEKMMERKVNSDHFAQICPSSPVRATCSTPTETGPSAAAGSSANMAAPAAVWGWR